MPKDMRTEKHHQNDFAILGRIYGGLPHLLSLERDCYYIKFRRNVKHFRKIQYDFLSIPQIGKNPIRAMKIQFGICQPVCLTNTLPVPRRQIHTAEP